MDFKTYHFTVTGIGADGEPKDVEEFVLTQLEDYGAAVWQVENLTGSDNSAQFFEYRGNDRVKFVERALAAWRENA